MTYIGKTEEDAIIRWNDSKTTDRERTELHEVVLYPAFLKLTQNLLFQFGQHHKEYTSDWTMRTVDHLFDKISRFDALRQKKAFSFFNQVASNYIKALMKRHNAIHFVSFEDSANELMDESYETMMDDPHEFIHYLTKRTRLTSALSTDEKEKIYLDSVIDLLERFETVDLSLSRKSSVSVYNLLKQTTGLRRNRMLKYRHRLLTLFEVWRKEFLNTR